MTSFDLIWLLIQELIKSKNAAMIGVAAYYEYRKGTRHGWDLNAVPNLKLGER